MTWFLKLVGTGSHHTAEQMLCRAVFVPKLASAVAISAAAAEQPLDASVLFSSAASLFGAPGAVNYQIQ